MEVFPDPDGAVRTTILGSPPPDSPRPLTAGLLNVLDLLADLLEILLHPNHHQSNVRIVGL